MNNKIYLVASIKSWHKPAFEAMTVVGVGKWFFIDSPKELSEILTRITPRYIFFLHWSEKIPQEIWSRIECVCFHMTDVPYGRGGSPLQNLIARGRKKTKLSALRVVKELDAGPVYTKTNISLMGRAEEIYLEAGKKSLEIARWIATEEPNPLPQEGKIVIFKRRTPVESVLPIDGEFSYLYDHIRMLDAPGYPQAFVEHGSFIIDFSHAVLEKDGVRASVMIRKK
jgi:methionyl-tRNA formyltransferase